MHLSIRKRLKTTSPWFISAVVASIVINSTWFFTFGILTYGDWNYTYTGVARHFFNLPQAWNTAGLGSTNITASFYPLEFIEGLFAHAHIGFAVFERLIYMWPIVIASCIGSYLLVYHFSKSHKAAFFGSMIYQFNSCTFILHTQHLNILGSMAFAPIFLLCAIKLYEKPSLRRAVITALAGLIMSIYDFRIFYIASLGLALLTLIYLILNEDGFRKQLKSCAYLLIAFVLIGLLSFYWLLGIGTQGQLTSNAVLSRSLFGSEYLPLENSIALWHSFWTIHGIEWFSIHTPPVFAWLLPSCFLLALVSMRRKSYIIGFSLIALLGIFLSKENAAPFGSVYYWLYTTFPGFNAFREASKFYILISLGYSVVIGTFLGQKLKSSDKTLRPQGLKFLSGAVIILIVLMVTPFYLEHPKSLFSQRQIPSSYLYLKNYLQKDSTDHFRTLWLPSTSRWTYSTNNKPASSITDILPQSSSDSVSEPFALQTNNYFASALAPKYLTALNYKYVIVPLRDTANEDDFFPYYGNNRSYFINSLNRQSWLKRINVGGDQLAVYKNRDFSPYISASTKLTEIADITKINSYAQFTSQELNNKTLDFTDSTANNAQIVNDIFSNIYPSQDGELVSHTQPNKSYPRTELYSDNDFPSYSYFVKSRTLQFSNTTQNNLSTNDGGAGLPANTIISSLRLDKSSSYLFSISNNTYPLDKSGATRNIGNTSDSINLFKENGPNMIQNGSFEQGPWQAKVQDCNNYDDNPKISMGVSKNFTSSGRQSLLLFAGNHTACTNSNDMRMSPGSFYNLSLNFKVQYGRRVGYDLLFNDSKHTSLSSDLLPNGSGENGHSAYFQAPPGATTLTLQLKGYPDDDNNGYAETYYDDVQIIPLEIPVNIASSRPLNFVPKQIDTTKPVKFSIDDKDTGKNLIKNPSLENGLWSRHVSDCDNYDNHPVLQMELEKSTKTNGRQSLEFRTTRHIACTGPGIVRVSEGKTYLLDFDYQSPNAQSAGYHLGFNDSQNSSVSQQISIDGTGWHHFQKLVKIPYGASKLDLTVYGYPDSQTGRQLINRYDNFSLVQVPDIESHYYLVQSNNKVLQTPEKISFQSPSPTKKLISVTSAHTPFYLNMSEAYNSGWRLELNDKGLSGAKGLLPNTNPTAVPKKDHLKLNGYANSWYVDPVMLCTHTSNACYKNKDGSYNIKLAAEFTPERYFYVGLTISGLTLIGCIAYLGGEYVLKSKHFKGWRYVGPR